MPIIIKQQQNLCCLFAIVNIFKPQSTLEEMQGAIHHLKIDVKKGMTFVEENFLIAEVTNNEIQLVPFFLNHEDGISESLFMYYFESLAEGEHSKNIFGCALLVGNKNLDGTLHRIWAFHQGGASKTIIVDTKFSETREFETTSDLWESYVIKGIFLTHSVRMKQNVSFSKEDIKHLLK